MDLQRLGVHNLQLTLHKLRGGNATKTGCLTAAYLIYVNEGVGHLSVRLYAPFKWKPSSCTTFFGQRQCKQNSRARNVGAKFRAQPVHRTQYPRTLCPETMFHATPTCSRTHHHPQQPPRYPKGEGRWSRRVVSRSSPVLKSGASRPSSSIRCTGSL